MTQQNVLNIPSLQNKFMSHTTIKWVLRAKSIKLYTNRRAKNIYIDLSRFNTRGTTSPTYIKSFLVSRYLSKNLPIVRPSPKFNSISIQFIFLHIEQQIYTKK